jgi:hypothetical protein
MKVKMVAHIVDCEEAIDKNRYMVKRSLHLHKKLKNVYKQKMVLQKENKVLKRKLHQIEEEAAKGIWTCSQSCC